METNNTVQFLNQYGEATVAALIARLRTLDKVSSGKLINSLKDEVVSGINEIGLRIKAESYFNNIVEGRKPGSFPPISDLQLWARTKGIPESAVFPIAKSIYKFGIKPVDVFSPIKQTLTEQLKGGMEKAFAQDIRQEIKNIKREMEK